MKNESGRACDPESLRVEYGDVGENWRFFIGARFLNLGFFGTFNGALLAFFSTLSAREASDSGHVMLLLLPMFGLLLTIAVVLIDHRCRVLFEAAYRRGKAIEQELGIDGGQYHALEIAGRTHTRGVLLVSHTKALMVIYILGSFLWLAVIVLQAREAI